MGVSWVRAGRWWISGVRWRQCRLVVGTMWYLTRRFMVRMVVGERRRRPEPTWDVRTGPCPSEGRSGCGADRSIARLGESGWGRGRRVRRRDVLPDMACGRKGAKRVPL